MSSIEICEFDDHWSETFLSLRKVFEEGLGDLIIRVEHVGSTAVKGLGAKPILDIDVVVENDCVLPEVSHALEQIGYFHQEEWSFEGREAFGRQDPFTPWGEHKTNWMDHHLYICTKDSLELARHLAFRDYLRSNPEAVAEYEKTKRRLAENSKDRAEYTKGKTDFITKILHKSMR